MRRRSPPELGFGDRPRIERAHLALERDRGLVPVEARFGFVDLVRVGDAVVGLRARRQCFAARDAREAFARAHRRRARRGDRAACRRCRRRAIGVRRSMQHGPGIEAGFHLHEIDAGFACRRRESRAGSAPRRASAAAATRARSSSRGAESRAPSRQDQAVRDDDHADPARSAASRCCASASFSVSGCSTAMLAASARCLTGLARELASATGRTIGLRVDRDDVDRRREAGSRHGTANPASPRTPAAVANVTVAMPASR